MWRAITAGVSVVVAAAVGVVTTLVTQHSSWGLWVALGVLVILGAVLQAAVTGRDRAQSSKVLASGSGAMAIGGSVGEIHTKVRASRKTRAVHAHASEDGGIVATGPGAMRPRRSRAGFPSACHYCCPAGCTWSRPTGPAVRRDGPNRRRERYGSPLPTPATVVILANSSPRRREKLCWPPAFPRRG